MRFVVVLAREPEIGDHHATVVGDQHVVGLEVAMHQPGCMSGREPGAGLLHRRHHLAPAGRALEPRAQRASLDELHREEHALAEHADVVDPDHVGVRELRHHLCLAEQPLLGATGMDELDRDVAAELRILGAIDLAHRAGADQLEQSIPPRRLTDPLPLERRRHQLSTRVAAVEVRANAVALGLGEVAPDPRMDRTIIETRRRHVAPCIKCWRRVSRSFYVSHEVGQNACAQL